MLKQHGNTCVFYLPYILKEAEDLLVFSSLCCPNQRESGKNRLTWTFCKFVPIATSTCALIVEGRLWRSEEVESSAGGSVFYQKDHPNQTGLSRRARLSVSINPFNMMRKQKKNPIQNWWSPSQQRSCQMLRVPEHLQSMGSGVVGQPGTSFIRLLEEQQP